MGSQGGGGAWSGKPPLARPASSSQGAASGTAWHILPGTSSSKLYTLNNGGVFIKIWYRVLTIGAIGES
jgi:hypothetical protein